MATLFWTNQDTGALEIFKFDATTSEDPSDVVTITDHPVETGVNIVDHARPEPERITLEGIVTDTPHHGNLHRDDNGVLIDGDADYVDQQVALTIHGMTDPGTQTIKLDVPDPPLAISPSGLIDAGIGAIGNAVFGGPKNEATAWGVPESKRQTAQARVLKSSSSTSRSRLAYEKLIGAKNVAELITIHASHREYFDMLIERVGAPVTPDDGDGLKFSIDLRRLRIAESQTVQAPRPTVSRAASAKSMGSQATKEDPNADAKLESTAYKLDPTNH